jgi:hypothetical protein
MRRWRRKAVGSSVSGCVTLYAPEFVTRTLHWSVVQLRAAANSRCSSQASGENVALSRTSSRKHDVENREGRCRLLERSM